MSATSWDAQYIYKSIVTTIGQNGVHVYGPYCAVHMHSDEMSQCVFPFEIVKEMRRRIENEWRAAFSRLDAKPLLSEQIDMVRALELAMAKYCRIPLVPLEPPGSIILTQAPKEKAMIEEEVTGPNKLAAAVAGTLILLLGFACGIVFTLLIV